MLAKRFHDLFRGLERAHGLWRKGEVDPKSLKSKGKAKTTEQPVTDELWGHHLKGDIGIGIIPVNDEATCIWGAIDIDVYDGLDHEALEGQIKEIGVPLLVCRSKSGGAHLYLFTSEPVSSRLIQQRLRESAMALGYPKAEIFPKQIEIDSDSGIGNWLNMPYQEADITTRYCIKDGVPLSPDEFLDFAEESKICKDELLDLAPRRNDEWADAPPCIEFLVKGGFPEGSRNNALLSLAVYAKKRYEEGEWQNKVSQYNHQWMSGSWDEVSNVIRSVSKKNYAYKCNDVPLCNHCNKAKCYERKYGITDGVGKGKKTGRKHSGEDAPCVLSEVDRPVKVFRPPPGSADEPQWVFVIAGKKMDVSLEMIMDQKKFLKAYTARFERLRLMVPEPRWQELCNEILQEAEVFELPPDAGPEGQLMLHLETFLTGKGKALDKSELLTGRPWTDLDNYTGKGENLTWFRSKDFVRYCEQQHFRSYKEKEMWAVFRRHGGENYKFQLKGRCVGAWGFPAFAEQNEELDKVEIQKEDLF